MSDDKKVIIVGNSPSILSEEYGSLIDSYDIVIRLNKCTTKGFEKYIGSKTDIWATTHQKYHNKFVPDDYKNIKELWKRTPHVKNFKFPKDFPKDVKELVMYKTSEFAFKQEISKLKKEPCTGLLAILTSTLFYKDITIVGFTFYTEHKNATAYYREYELDENGNHLEDEYWRRVEKSGFASKKNGEIKKNIVRKLVDEGKIKLLNPKEMDDEITFPIKKKEDSEKK